MSIKITKVIFDIFGVVVSPGFSTAASDLSFALDRPIKLIEPIYEAWEVPFDLGEISQKEFWDSVQKELNTKIDWRHLNNIVIDSYRMNPDALNLLNYCKKLTDVYFLSNTRREWYEELDKRFLLSKLVNETFLSYRIKAIKPQQKCFEFVIKNIGVKPENILFIDDRESNVNQANKMGINSLVYVDPEEIRHLINNKYHLTWEFNS